MIVTVTELKKNLNKYLKVINNEDVLITKRGKVVAKLSKPKSSKVAAINNLVGIADNGSDVSLDDIKEERLKSK